MPRCSICDYHPTLGSDYSNRLASPSCRVVYSRTHDDWICTDCLDEIEDTLAEWADEEYEDEEFLEEIDND